MLRPCLFVVVILCAGVRCSSLAQSKVDDLFDNTLPKKAAELLGAAEAIELLSLDPHADKAEGGKDGADRFHRWKVLGSTTVNDAVARGKLVEAVLGGIPKTAIEQQAAACFIPRHGLRAKVSGTVVELVICYECNRINVYIDGEFQRLCVTKSDPQKVLNELLTSAKVPLPTKPKEGK